MLKLTPMPSTVGAGSKPVQIMGLCIRVGLEPTPTSYIMILLGDFSSALKLIFFLSASKL